MKNNIIAFYPYSYSANTYHGMIQEMLAEKYFVVDYNDLKKRIFQLEDIDAIYLNWIEDAMNDSDKELIVNAVAAGIKVYWVFHNRVTHAVFKEKECRENVLFLIKNVSDIIILSHASIGYLYEYDTDLEEDKIHFLPHQEYIGNYGRMEDKALKDKISGAEFVFGCIGSIRSDKNIELLIKAFKSFSHNENCILLITGGVDSKECLESLEVLAGNNKNIILLPNHIPDYMMDFYVQLTDVILLPYDLKTSMNSGVMLLTFTNKRTVISSNISMAEEFNDELLYKYSYLDEADHMKKILLQMENAYMDGRQAVREKGARLYEEIVKNNSKELVKSRLYDILGEFPSRKNQAETRINLIKEYRDKDLWRMRYTMADAWLCNILSGNRFMKILKENSVQKIAIYGYGKYGKMLFGELKKNGLPITCIIDQNADNIHESVAAYTLDSLEEALDFVIVTTAAADINRIKEYCCNLNSSCYVISLKDV